ncbi:MAG: hypothetical protein ACM3NT_06575 [Methylocystaceae bacterium]
MKKWNVIILSSLLILGLAFGLSLSFARTGEAKIATGPSKYFPLTVGSYWIYEGTGNEFASFKRTVVYAQGNRGQIEEAGGDISGSVFLTNQCAVTRIYFSPEQYQRKNLLNATPNDNTIIINTPLSKGTIWYTREGTRTITSLNTRVETPAGQFKNCLAVKLQGDGYTITEYFAPRIGMVKRVYRSPGNDNEITSALKKYLIKKQS